MQKTILNTIFGFLLVHSTLVMADLTDKGVGPAKEISLSSTIDKKLSASGSKIFTNKCSACHKIEERYVGPALRGITTKRSPEWIMNMILNPAEMIEKNEAAKELFGEYLVPMTFQNVTQEESRALLEYFRNNDQVKQKNKN